MNSIKLLVAFVIVCLLLGCESANEKVVWRTDLQPVTSRIPALKSWTNIVWHAETATKSSFFSPPGPSAFKITCFIPNAKSSVNDLDGILKSLDVQDSLVKLSPKEIESAQIKLNLNLNSTNMKMGAQLKKRFISPPYFGDCIYFTDADVLCVILIGEK